MAVGVLIIGAVVALAVVPAAERYGLPGVGGVEVAAGVGAQRGGF